MLFSLPILLFTISINYNMFFIITLFLILMLLYNRLFKTLFLFIGEYNKNISKEINLKNILIIFLLGLLGILNSFKGYLDALKFNNDD